MAVGLCTRATNKKMKETKEETRQQQQQPMYKFDYPTLNIVVHIHTKRLEEKKRKTKKQESYICRFVYYYDDDLFLSPELW